MHVLYFLQYVPLVWSKSLQISSHLLEILGNSVLPQIKFVQLFNFLPLTASNSPFSRIVFPDTVPGYGEFHVGFSTLLACFPSGLITGQNLDNIPWGKSALCSGHFRFALCFLKGTQLTTEGLAGLFPW